MLELWQQLLGLGMFLLAVCHVVDIADLVADDAGCSCGSSPCYDERSVRIRAVRQLNPRCAVQAQDGPVACRGVFTLNEDWVATIVGLVLLVLVLTGVIPTGLVP